MELTPIVKILASYNHFHGWILDILIFNLFQRKIWLEYIFVWFSGSLRDQEEEVVVQDGEHPAERLRQVALRARLQLPDSAGPRKGPQARPLQRPRPFPADGLHLRRIRRLLHHGAFHEAPSLGPSLRIRPPPFQGTDEKTTNNINFIKFCYF